MGRVDVDIESRSARIANFTNLATLYSSARKGVDDAVASEVSKLEVMLHLAFGWNYTLQALYYDALTGNGIVSADDWDMFGISFYPWDGLNAT